MFGAQFGLVCLYWATQAFAQATAGWGEYAMPVQVLIGASVAFLAILRWRDADIKRITADLKKEWQDKTDALDARIQALEARLEYVEGGAVQATMRFVEIKATSFEPRTQELAQFGIEALSLQGHGPTPSAPVV